MGTHLGPDPKGHDFHDFGSSPAGFKEDFPLRATLPRNIKISLLAAQERLAFFLFCIDCFDCLFISYFKLVFVLAWLLLS